MDQIAPESPIAETEILHMTVDMEKNVYSQSGEDGIIAKILEVNGYSELPGIYVEIGANDGFHCSNTANLRAKGGKSLLIESDIQHRESLTAIPDAEVKIIEVTPENVVDLCRSMMDNPFVDVFSCDTDGDDVAITCAVLRAGLRPHILVVEYNPTFPPFLYRMNTHGRQQGSSIKAAIDEITRYDYDCVYATISNVIFVDKKWTKQPFYGMNPFEAFRWDDVRFVCSDFDGQNHFATMTEIVNDVYNPWDRLPSAKIMHYSDRLLGFSKAKAKLRSLYNPYGE